MQASHDSCVVVVDRCTVLSTMVLRKSASARFPTSHAKTLGRPLAAPSAGPGPTEYRVIDASKQLSKLRRQPTFSFSTAKRF